VNDPGEVKASWRRDTLHLSRHKRWAVILSIALIMLISVGCRYPNQPLNVPTYGLASPIPTINTTPSLEPTFTQTTTPTPSFTPVPSDTATPKPTDTLTPLPTQTETPVPTETPTLEPTQTPIPSPTETSIPEPTQTEPPEPTAPFEISPLVFAAIGDYGGANSGAEDVANLIKSWQPEFIITLGDNNYPVGAADHIDLAIGQFFHDYIYPYQGNFGAGSDINRFFPTLGNHDIYTDLGQPYLDYFTLPGNERYYDFVWGPVHFFALDDLETEPDGVGVSSIQAAWLQQGLANSSSAWNIVYMHYPPYSSALHGPTTWAQWPYGEWGADAVLSGHDHVYERLQENGLTYFVCGMGGYLLYNFYNIMDGSQVRFNTDFGAMRVEATEQSILFEFITRKNVLIDQVLLEK
jgi:hypothetical protein